MQHVHTMVEIMISPDPRQWAECSHDRPVRATSLASTMPARVGALGSLAVSTAAHMKVYADIAHTGILVLVWQAPCARADSDAGSDLLW